ncbi:TetR/AcrR family transcriptional regulator [Curtobacterium sp. RRHDQ10]|uniref:TetR/AcrR family transcriptional regulator n=1 Tax=Curtobacterium phyllosphaerae TaxID=3413379 RepID=UPI003BF3920E
MPRKSDPTLRPAIVEKVVQHLWTTPVEDVSVRGLGRVLGTSAYPIVYHFGSREALLDAVVDDLASRCDAVTLEPDADAAVLESWVLAVFGGLDDPSRSLAARLAFELGSVESLGGHERHRRLHRRQVDVVAAWATAHGMSPADAARAANDVVLAARGVQWGGLLDHDADAAARALTRIAHRLIEAAGFVAR